MVYFILCTIDKEDTKRQQTQETKANKVKDLIRGELILLNARYM